MHHAQTFIADWPKIDAVQGWLSVEAAALMDFLLVGQSQLDAPSAGLLEIGVWKGRTSALMARHLRAGETMWLVDTAPQQAEITQNLQAVLGDRFSQLPIQLLQGTAREAQRSLADQRFRYIHIDGEHTAGALRGDLALSLQIMAPAGLIVIDDIFNDLYPQLARALFAFLDQEGRDLACVLTGFNKAVLCHTRYMDHYGDLIFEHLHAEMAARRVPVTLCRTTNRVEWPGYSVVSHIGIPRRGPDYTMEYLRP